MRGTFCIFAAGVLFFATTHFANADNGCANLIKEDKAHDALAVELAGGMSFRYYNAERRMMFNVYYCPDDAPVEASVKLLEIFKAIGGGFQHVDIDSRKAGLINPLITHNISFIKTDNELRVVFDKAVIDDVDGIAEIIGKDKR
ncbi:MAG: hypothetical protein HZA25_00055 [Candidatus Niyogibacteria bacterium]|nr:hypothetical protein [Candidatus Niyogibacteria bacterium]